MINLKLVFPCLIIAMVSMPLKSTAGDQKRDIYLSPEGKDTNLGTTTAPLRSLKAAAKLIENLTKSADLDEITIWLAPGIYSQRETVSFTQKTLNKKDIKLTIRSFGGEKARIDGGISVPVDKFNRVKEKEQLSRLHDKARGKVYAADLTGTKAGSAFEFIDVDKKWNPRSDHFSLLSWNEHLLQLAQWPNRGYHHIKTILDEGPTNRWLKPDEESVKYSLESPAGGKFNTVEQTDWEKWNAEFKPEGQIIAQGYFHNDWYFQSERIGAINNNEIKLLHDTRYGIHQKKGMIPRRVRVVNLLCELDQPGEWYFDHAKKVLYIWPIDEITEQVNLAVLGGGTMMSIKGLNNFKIHDMVFENGGKLGIEIKESSNSIIAGCTFRNFTGRGFEVTGGKNNGVISSDFYGLHSVGSMRGGNRQTLEPSDHYMVNNEMWNCRMKGYGLVGLSGVGIRFANNVIHDANGAPSFSGNDIVLEYNEFYNMGWEMGDWNAIYIGADWASFGNKVQYNFVHHLMETPEAYPVEGFRNDDLGMGVSFEGNIFYKSGRGCIAFSGAGNTAKYNIAIQSGFVWSVHVSEKGDIKKRWEGLKEYDNGVLKRGDKDDFLWRAEQIYGKMGWLFEPYASKYPILKKIMQNGNPWGPTFSEISFNYTDQPKRSIYVHKATVEAIPTETYWKEPVSIDPRKAFVDLSTLNFKFKDDFSPMTGFKATAFEKIGLYGDEYRKNLIEKSKYRKDVKERYKNTPSAGGSYNMKTVNNRYPLPAYLLNSLK